MPPVWIASVLLLSYLSTIKGIITCKKDLKLTRNDNADDKTGFAYIDKPDGKISNLSI